MISVDLQRGPVAGIWRRDPCMLLYEIAARYPGESLGLHLGGETVLLFQDVVAARHIAHERPENYRKNFGPFIRFFGASRLTSDGELWQKLQRLSRPYIVGVSTQSVADATVRHFGAAIDDIVANSAFGPLVVDPFLNRAAAAVIAEVALGFGPDDLSPTLAEDFAAILRYASLTAWNLPGAPQMEDVKARDLALRARERLKSGLDALVARRLRHGGEAGLLEALATSAGEGVDLFGEVCTMLFAGFDTSATALGWAMWLLGAELALQNRLRDEVQAATVPPAELSGIGAFQNEALRIFPPVPMLSRIAVEADEVDGVAVMPGQRVLLSVVGLHNDARFHPEPRRPVLERYDEGNSERTRQEHLIPFGTGPRGCPGAKIARTELRTAIALIIERLRIERPPGDKVEFEWTASLRRRGGQRLQITANA